MIALTTEMMRYLELVRDVDPRATDVLREARVVFEPLGTLGGDCGHDQIRINSTATDDHQRTTLGHELAHLLDRKLFKGRGHGVGWAFWMRKLGLPVEKTHAHEELIRQHHGPTYVVTCYDCGKANVYTFAPNNCQQRDCLSPDVRVDRADGFKR